MAISNQLPKLANQHSKFGKEKKNSPTTNSPQHNPSNIQSLKSNEIFLLYFPKDEPKNQKEQ
jgi:hypothetical protein